MPVESSRRWRGYCFICGIVFILCSVLIITPITWGADPKLSICMNSNTTYKSRTQITARNSEPIWPMFGKDQYHSHVTASVNKGIHKPALKWDHWSEDLIIGNSIDSWATTVGNFTFNINGDDRNVEHVAYADSGHIIVADGSTGNVSWQLNVDQIDNQIDNDLVFTAPTLGFIDDNNDLDIVFGSSDGNLYMYEPKITYDKDSGYSWSTNNVIDEKVWQSSTGENFTESSPVLAKLDTDNYFDVVVGAGDKLFAVSGTTGNELWNKTLPGNIISSPIVYEDGTKKTVMVTSFLQSPLNFSANFFNGETGNSLDKLYFDLVLNPGTLDLLPSTAANDLDENMNNGFELIVCTPFEGIFSNGRVYVYHTNRSLFWSTGEDQITGQIDSTPAVGDLDGDGFPEIVIVSWNQGTIGPLTNVYAFHGNNGSLVWHVVKDTIGVPQPPYTNERAVASPILADLDDDNKLDVLFGTSPNLFAISGLNGTDLWEFSLEGQGRRLWSTPAAGDIDKDGFLDVVFEGAAISHVIIDLTLSGADLYLSTENITENQPVTIHAVVHNNGSAAADDVKVSFFENGLLIGNGTKNSIPAFDSRELIMDWTPKKEGTQTLKVILDPDEAIEEINELNNEVSKEINVIPSYPDLIIDAVYYYRGDGSEVDNMNTHLIEDEVATITIIVKNIGKDEAENIQISAKDSGISIDNDKDLALLDIQGTGNVTFVWSQPDPGSHELTFYVSLEDTNQELNISNNDRIDQIIVNSKIPIDPTFYSEGVVLQPNNVTAAVNIDVRFTNNRTGSQIITTTNETGFYSIDLSTLPGQYYEGDEIVIFASDGENATSLMFVIYSEDLIRFDNITLVKVPIYAISISVDDASLEVLPNGEVEYHLTITNRGNEENTVNLSISDILDVQTNEIPANWSASLNQYIITGIPPKGSFPVILTLEAPAKRSEARAKDQVLVAVSAKSAYDPNQIDIVGMTTTVARLYEFSINIDSPIIALDPIKNQTVNLGVKISNDGNKDDTVNIKLSTPTDWVASFNTSVDLLLGEEKEIEIILTCNENVAAGEHSFNLNIGSIDNQGNTSKILIVNILRPDLNFSGNITMTPPQPSLSTTITFTTTIQNMGTANANMFIVEFRVRSSIQDTRQVYNLTAGGQMRLIFNWTPSSTGKYLIEFELDPYEHLIEISKENNINTMQLEFNADLALIEEPKFSNTRPYDGDKITISITIDNIGNVDITDSFTVDFYDGDPNSGGDRFEQYIVTEEIPTGRDIDISVHWIARGGGKEHTIYVDANPEHDFEEIDYENNANYRTITVTKKPGVEEDYSLLIALIFIIGIILIIFLVLAPSKQKAVKDQEKDKDQAKPKSKSKKSGKGAEKVKGSEKEKQKALEKVKSKPGESTKEVKFKIVGEEKGEIHEDAEVKELEAEENEEGTESEVTAQEEIEAEETDDKSPRVRHRGGKQRLGKKVTSGLGNLISGRWLPVSKTKPKITAGAEEEEEDQVSVDEEYETLAEMDEPDTVEPMVDEDELAEIEVAEVEVVSEEPLAELEPEPTEVTGMEVDAIDEVELEEELEELASEEEEESKDKKDKRKKDPGWEYSHMIGIR